MIFDRKSTMNKISLDSFSISRNYVLIKPDPDFEFIEITTEDSLYGPSKTVELQVGYTSETHGRHFGITGKILAVPDHLIFNKSRIDNYKKRIGSSRSVSDMIKISCLMEDSNELDTDMELQLGDKVWFSYLCQINAVTDGLIIDIEEHGLCFLARYEELYCFERNGEIELINGWCWIDRKEEDTVSPSGLQIQFSDKNKYQSGIGFVIKSGKPVRNYIDGSREYPWAFKHGDEVIYSKKMGHPMEYSLHRKLTDREVYSVRRKHIYARV